MHTQLYSLKAYYSLSLSLSLSSLSLSLSPPPAPRVHLFLCPCVCLGLPGESLDSEVAEELKLMGFEKAGMLKRKVDSLPGRWGLKLELARARLMRPDLLLLDEPTRLLETGNDVAWLGDVVRSSEPHRTRAPLGGAGVEGRAKNTRLLCKKPRHEVNQLEIRTRIKKKM